MGSSRGLFPGFEGASYQEATTPVDDGRTEQDPSLSRTPGKDFGGAIIYMDAINLRQFGQGDNGGRSLSRWKVLLG